MIQKWKTALEEAQTVLQNSINDSEFLENCQKFTQKIIQTIQNKGTLFSAGNGGSNCDALHFAEEWTGRYCKNREPVAALALGENSHNTCTGNDFGFEYIFSRQLQALGRKGDLFLAISTSGNSKNIIKAVEVAKAKGIFVVGLLGKDGGLLKDMVDLPIVVPSNTTSRIQEMHIKVIHNSIEWAEEELFFKN